MGSLAYLRATMRHVDEAWRGVAYGLWERVNREMSRQEMTQVTLAKRANVPAKTINHLKVQTRPPAARIVNALADALGIDREEAAVLAGRVVPRTTVMDVREVIRNSAYAPKQREMLLDLVDALDRANEVIRDAEQAG